MERLKENVAERDRHSVREYFDPQVLGQLKGQGFHMRVYSLARLLRLSEIQGNIHNIHNPLKALPQEFLEDMVLKVTRTEPSIPPKILFPPSSPEVKLRMMRIAGSYLSPFLVDPTYMIEQDNKYLLIQRKLGSYTDIIPQNVGFVQEQMDDLKRRMGRLVRDGMYVELLGGEGVIAGMKTLISSKARPRMTNVVIERGSVESNFTEDRVRMPDIALLQIGQVPLEYQNLFPRRRKEGSKMLYLISSWLIKRHFGMEFKET